MNYINLIEQDEWEAERKRRLSYMRRRAIRDGVRESRITVAVLVACVVGLFAFLAWWNATRPMRDRAAYLEGRLGVDHATAVALAEREVR